jgi:hypothetical protein
MIAVLNGFAPGEDGESGLLPVLNGAGDLAAWAAAARTAGRQLPALLHVDTGMARLGLAPAEIDAVVADPARLAGLDLRYVMSHLACADDPENPLNALQARRFAAIRTRLPGVPGSFANSSGLFRGMAYASDLARPGCALFGINPTPGAANPLRQVVTLDAPILQVREIAAGTSVGYGAMNPDKQAEAKLANAQAQAQAAAKQAAKMASLSDNARLVEEYVLASKNRAEQLRGGKDRPNTELHAKARALSKRFSRCGWASQLLEAQVSALKLEGSASGTRVGFATSPHSI